MKNLLILTLFILSGLVVHAQTGNNYIYGDSIILDKRAGFGELKLHNRSSGVPGFLKNLGNGATGFVPAQDSMYFRNDTCYWRIGNTWHFYKMQTPSTGGPASNIKFFDTTVIGDGHTLDFTFPKDSVSHVNLSNKPPNFDSVYYNGSSIVFRFHIAPDSLSPVHLSAWYVYGQPLAFTNFGILNSNPSQYSPEAFAASLSMGFKTYRAGDILDDGAGIGNVITVVNAGFDGVDVNVNMHASDPHNPRPIMSYDSVDTLSKLFFTLASAYPSKNKIVVTHLDNEEDNKCDVVAGDTVGYHIGTLQQCLNNYVSVFPAFANAAHAKGFKVSNGGLTAIGAFTTLAYWYQLHGYQAKFDSLRDAFFPGLTADTLTGTYRSNAITYFDYLPQLAPYIDYFTVHIYDLNASYLPTFVFEDFETMSYELLGVPCITNEMGTYRNDVAGIQWLHNGVTGRFVLAIYYAGNTGAAKSFNDAAGVLNTNGTKVQQLNSL